MATLISSSGDLLVRQRSQTKKVTFEADPEITPPTLHKRDNFVPKYVRRTGLSRRTNCLKEEEIACNFQRHHAVRSSESILG